MPKYRIVSESPPVEIMAAPEGQGKKPLIESVYKFRSRGPVTDRDFEVAALMVLRHGLSDESLNRPKEEVPDNLAYTVNQMRRSMLHPEIKEGGVWRSLLESEVEIIQISVGEALDRAERRLEDPSPIAITY